MSDNLIELNNVSFSYPGGEPVLKSINLELKKNDLLIIRGDSGAGKSTFLKLFNRFCEADNGNFLLHGKEILKYKLDVLRASIIYFPQLPVMIDGTVEENLSFPFHFNTNRNKQFDPGKAMEWLSYFQLDIPLKHDASKLSVGQKQRVALVRSILLEPEVLLLDEPFSALDNANQKLIERNIENLISSSHLTVLMATHSDVGFDKNNYRILRLKEGELCE